MKPKGRAMAEPEPRTKRSTLDPETLRIIERARDGALLMMQETACGMLEGYPWSARMNAVANELIHFEGLFKPRVGERHLHRKDVLRVESRIHRAQGDVSSNQQSRSNQHDQRKSYFTDDKQ